MSVKTKRFVDALGDWVKTKTREHKRAKDACRVAFLAVKADVQAALDAGHSVKTVWAYLHEQGSVNMTYEAFRRHVNKAELLTSRQAVLVEAAPPDVLPPAEKPKEPRIPKLEERKFEFNPKPNQEELI